MAGAEDLPGYTTVDFVLSPKHSPLPSHDRSPTIGGQRVTRPLISIQQLKSHLRLLGMFALLKEKVEVPELDPQLVQTIPPLAGALSPGKRWIWFLELAVERYVLVAIGYQWFTDYSRFKRWVACLNASRDLFVLPPIDVWIVWHVYMLNPVWVTSIGSTARTVPLTTL
jgi:hypothetical protein